MLVGGELFYQMIRRVALLTANPHLLPGMVLIGALIVPVTFVVFLWGRRYRSTVSLPDGLVVGIAGGCGAIAAAAAAEQLAIEHGVLSSGAVASIEEVAKLLVVAAALRWVAPWTAPNGLVLGAAAGAGFSVVETLGYVFVDYLRPDGGMAALNADLLIRSIFAPATHLAWTAVTGWALGCAGGTNRRSGAAVPLGVFLAVTAVHALWDLSRGLGGYLALTVVMIAALTLVLRTQLSTDSDDPRPNVGGAPKARPEEPPGVTCSS